MRQEDFAPGPVIAAYVDGYFRLSLDGRDPPRLDHVISPNPFTWLWITRYPGGVAPGLAGPSAQPRTLQMQQGMEYGGVRLRPGAALPIPGVGDLTGRVLGPLEIDPRFSAWCCAAFAGVFGPSPAAAMDVAIAHWPFHLS